MSFIGRAAVWTHVNASANAGTRSQRRRPGPTGARLTPLNVMTGSRIAASDNSLARWAGGQTWDGLVISLPLAAQGSRAGQPRLAEQLLRPYRQLFDVLGRRTAKVVEPRVCHRCGQPPHNDWGREYERLVCMETTSA